MKNVNEAHLRLTRRAAFGGITAVVSACAPQKKTPQQKNTVTLNLKAVSWQLVDDLAHAIVAHKIAPGLSISLMSGGHWLYSKGFGVLDTQSNRPVNAQSRFRIASVTKQFTASAILKLHEVGKLHIDDPLAKFFPDLPQAHTVSLRQMMQHISGMGDHVNGQKAEILSAAQTKDYDDGALLNIIKDIKPLFPLMPGARWRYSNSAFTLLGLIVHRVSGQTFGQFCTEHFFKPLGMKNTTVDPVGYRSEDQALGYRATRTSSNGFGEVLPASASFLGGAGAITGSTEDLCRWHNMLLGGRILRFDSLKNMLTPATLNDGRLADQHRGSRPLGYGLGQGLGTYANRLSITHNGRINGFVSHLGSIPEANLTVAMLMNCDGIGGKDFNTGLRDLRDEARRLALLALGFEDIGPWIAEQNAKKVR
jgi:CubicO group peptidase (beta-lactamase class C family)